MGYVYKAVNQNGDTISHWRTKGSKNGIRLWQHEDGSYTTAGRNSKPGGRYNQAENHEDGSSVSKTESASSKKAGSSKTNASGSSKSSSSSKKSSVTTINDVIFSETTKNVLCVAGLATLLAATYYYSYAYDVLGDPRAAFESLITSNPLEWFTGWAAGVERDFNNLSNLGHYMEQVADDVAYVENQSTDMYSEVIDSTLKSSEDYVKTYKDYLKKTVGTVDDNVTKFGERAANAEAKAKATGEYADRFYDKEDKTWRTYSSLKSAKNEGSSMSPSSGDIIEPDWYTKSDPKLLKGR